MGLKSSPFSAQQVAEQIFSKDNLMRFLESEGLTLNSPEFPFDGVSSFEIIYQDDILIHSLKSWAWITLIRFLLFCCIIVGVKISKKKAHVLEETVKFLGFDYNTKTNSSQIPEDRQQGFEKLRAPKSLAKPNIRLGSFSYFKSYVPNLKKLAAPLLSLEKSKNFTGINWRLRLLRILSSSFCVKSETFT